VGFSKPYSLDIHESPQAATLQSIDSENSKMWLAQSRTLDGEPGFENVREPLENVQSLLAQAKPPSAAPVTLTGATNVTSTGAADRLIVVDDLWICGSGPSLILI
jgi:hypothetical protein